MKNIFFLFAFVISASAFAENKETKSSFVNENIIIQYDESSLKDHNKIENDTVKSPKKPLPLASRISGDDARFDISVLIVDFINRNNIKIAKHLLRD